MATIALDLIAESQLGTEITRRLSTDLRVKIVTGRQAEFEADGWIIEKTLKHALWMRKPKSHESIFQDRVWAMCARLGFLEMSRGVSVVVSEMNDAPETRHFNILAADAEVVLVVECKSSDAERPAAFAFKTETAQIRDSRAELVGALREQFPGRKVKFLFATNNIRISEDAQSRIADADILVIDEETVNYYHDLADHLGTAAKFQFLGNLFQGEKITALDSKVPAIQGKMGGYTYYSFTIEPERLLKLAYVLHRNNANSQWMPTYQRIIKKSRLKRVAEFVERGGFFPNSLIVNIDTGTRGLKFERAANQIGSSKLGILQLPQKYRSAYIIDGQHRLYGFAKSKRSSTELVPVVAFVDLPGEKQLELFMQINENQQAVPKNLRLTLKADLEWDSSDRKRQAQALKLKIAQLLGERKTSPLRGRVILGEEKSNDRLCVTLDTINRGIDRGRFIGEFTATEMKKVGSFYRGSNEATYKSLVEFFELCFDYLSEQLPTQWNAGKGEGGFVFTNPGVEALLRLIGDFVDYLVTEGRVDPRSDSPRDVFGQVRELLAHLVDYLSGVSVSEVAEYKSWFGSGGPTKYLRRFQTAIVEKVDGFEPDGYLEWKVNQEKQFNQESYSMINDIEQHMKQDVRRRLEDKFRSNWYRDGVPKRVYQAAQALRADKQYEAAEGTQVDWWDCLFLIDYHSILHHGAKVLWDELYDAAYTLPSDVRAQSWKNKSGWVIQLNEIRKKTHHGGGSAVTEEEYGFLQSLHSHFELGGTGRND